MHRYVLIGLLACSLSGCLHTTFTTGKPRGGQRESGWNHFFLWGLANTAETDLIEACPNGVAKFTVYQSFAAGLVEIITFGIYSPRTWEADCATASSAAVPTVGTEVAP